MKKLIFAAALLAPVLWGGTATAQDGAAPVMYAYATYFVCSPDGESRADEIIRSNFKPHYDAAVEQGDIASWSWMQHFVGGEWRRVLLIVAPDMNSIIDASGALGEIIEDETPEAGRAFSGICSSHEDYIWRTLDGIGSAPADRPRGAVGFSVYLQCEMGSETRADEIIRDVVAPVYNRRLGDDGFASWGWLAHHVGGEYRRLLVFGAADHKTMMRARESARRELDGRRYERAMRELAEICPAHRDYMWDIAFQTP